MAIVEALMAGCTVAMRSDGLDQSYYSLLYRRLLKERALFFQIDAYVTANLDPGLLVVEGRPADGVSMEAALAAVWEELEALKAAPIPDRELEKIKHRFESTVVFSEMSALNKAQNLSSYELMSHAELMNEETATYLALTPADLQRAAQEIFRADNSATLIYVPEK